MRSILAALLLLSLVAMLSVSSQNASSAHSCDEGKVSVHMSLSDPPYSACCGSATDCAYEQEGRSDCYAFGSRRSGAYCGIHDFGANAWIFPEAKAIIYGTVKNASEDPEEGVNVWANETPDDSSFVKKVTDSFGRYFMRVKRDSSYTVNVSKAAFGYENNITVFTPSGVIERNYTLVRPLQLGCTDDCTQRDGLCHQECDGQGLCTFSNEKCHLSVPGIITITDPDDSSVQLNCCMGTPELLLKAQIDVCDDNFITIARSVLLKGRRVNMVIAMYNNKAESCSQE